MASARVGRRSRWNRDSSSPSSRNQRSRSSSLERYRPSRSPARESRRIEESRVISSWLESPGPGRSSDVSDHLSPGRASPLHCRKRSRSRSLNSSASPPHPHHQYRHRRRHHYRHRSRSASCSQSPLRSPIHRSRSRSPQYERPFRTRSRSASPSQEGQRGSRSTRHPRRRHRSRSSYSRSSSGSPIRRGRSRSQTPQYERPFRTRSRSASLSQEGHRESRPGRYPHRRHRSRSTSYSRSSSGSPIRRDRSRSQTPQYESRFHCYSGSTYSPHNDYRRSGPPMSAQHSSQCSRSPYRKRFSRSPPYRPRSPFPSCGFTSPNNRGRPCHMQRSCGPEECTESRSLEQTESSVSSTLQPRYSAPAPTCIREFRETNRSTANRSTACAMPATGGDTCFVKGEPLNYSIDTTDPELLRLATCGEIGGVVFDGTTVGGYPRRNTRKSDNQALESRSGHSRSDSPRAEAPALKGGKGSWHTDTLEFFWGSQSPFSQHHRVQFSLEGLTFNCSEQYMMYQKAMMFGAKDIAQRIMQSSDSGEIKKLGRLVPNFNPETWDRACYEVVKKANMAKFSQNAQLLRQLKETHPRQLVEASPNDKKWGIGIASSHPLATQPDHWPGENLLGKILTEVRSTLMSSA